LGEVAVAKSIVAISSVSTGAPQVEQKRPPPGISLPQDVHLGMDFSANSLPVSRAASEAAALFVRWRDERHQICGAAS
jgi:hypothetical protein